MHKDSGDCKTETNAVRLAGSFFKEGRTGVLMYSAVFFIYAALLLLVCTRNSPLFTYQTWVDPNIYMDVGKSVQSGLVLYRDVFDHKGPLLLLCFSVLSRISPHSMTSVYLLQSITLGISLSYLFRTAKLFLSKTESFALTLIFPFFLLNTFTYGTGGGSAEELLLPCFMGGMFYIIRAFLPANDASRFMLPGNTPPGQFVTASGNNQEVRYRVWDFFFLGLLAGIVIMTKINLAVFFAAGCAGLFALFFFTKQRQRLIKSCGLFFAGIFTAALPCLIYFTATNSFKDFWNVYITFNLQYASAAANDSNRMTFLGALDRGLFLNLAAVLCIAGGFLAFLIIRKRAAFYGAVSLIILFAVTLTAVYISGRAYLYQYIPNLCFTGVGEIGICLALQNLQIKLSNKVLLRKPSAAVRAAAFAIIAAGIIGSNTLYTQIRFFQPEKTGVEKISDTILETWQPKKEGETPSILLFNTGDIGFFDLTESQPKLRVFYMPMINLNRYPDLLLAQQGYINSGLADYIICIGYSKEFDYGVTDLNPKYQMIDLQGQYIDSTLNVIKLYAKTSTAESDISRSN